MTEAGAKLPLPPVIGHRGAAASAPENTLAGLRTAHELGARWVEFDVRLCRDQRCILLHDDTVERTTDGTGHAARLTFDELAGFDAGGWFAPRFAGERIPSFEETIALLGALRLGANVEIKPARGAEAATARHTVAELRRFWPAHLPPPLLSSFAPAALEAVQDEAPELIRGYLFGRLPADWEKRAGELGCTTIHCDHRHLDEAQARRVIDAGYPLLVYTVNDPIRARELLGWGVASVITDCPDRVILALRESEESLAK